MATTLAWMVASADPGVVDVRGDGTCLRAAGVVARAQGWGGHTQWPSDVAVVVDHTAATLTIRVTRGTGDPVERTFTAVPAECDDVELMAAVAIAMALDVLEQTAPEPAPVEAPVDSTRPAVEIAPSRPPTVTLVRTELRVRPVRPQVSLLAGVGAAIGLVPFATGEAALGVRVAWRPVALVGELELGARRVARFDGERGSLGIARVAGTLGVCSPWARGRWMAGLCGLASAGPVIARARDTSSPRAAVVPWVAALVRTELGVAVSARWSLVARNDLAIGLVRPTVAAARVSGEGTLRWPTPRVGWRGTLAAQLRLGRIPPGPAKRRALARMEGPG